MAAVHRRKAVLIMSNDGHINWAWSSEPTAKADAFFRTRGNVIFTGRVVSDEHGCSARSSRHGNFSKGLVPLR